MDVRDRVGAFRGGMDCVGHGEAWEGKCGAVRGGDGEYGVDVGGKEGVSRVG